jgi:GMP synthase (glutamine-hydrolysing)
LNPEKFIEEKVGELKREIDGNAVMACSGGVDSMTAAVLTSRAIGDRLLAVYVDTGYMRKNETSEVSDLLSEMGVNRKVVKAEKRFYSALEDVIEPEEKRKIIGKLFIDIFEEEAMKFDADYLVQGTIAPDWIESGGYPRDKIKSHHNVAGLPKGMKLKLVEPLRDLYKDEVRKIAKVLGLKTAERQPFPGPGLAVRIIGAATEEAALLAKEANAIVEEEIEKAAADGRMKRPWQYFAVVLPVKTVGVHGDLRVYGYTIAVRAVDSVDGMSASFSKLPDDVLERISTRITNELKNVNRVIYDITHKPPGTIEWE